MKINFSPQHFKGYDACKIKNLHMQNIRSKTRNFKCELDKIGKKEKFKVFSHNFNKFQGPLEDDCADEVSGDVWAQDNKIYRNINGTTKIFTPALRGKEDATPFWFSRLQNKEIQFTETIFEGGNLFIGKKENGDDWILTGFDTIYLTSLYLFLKDKKVENITAELMQEFTELKETTQKENGGGEIIHHSDYEKECDFYNQKALDTICEEFQVKKENVFIVPQPDFHIDLYLRPIGYPYILVNDDEEIKKNIERIFPENTQESVNLKANLKLRESKYCKEEEIVETLKNYGFVPIKIAGAYGDGINFINAIVNQHNNGKLSYITNSSSCATSEYSKLQNIFKKTLKKKVPNIKNIYFIKGGNTHEAKNDIMNTLYLYGGGIHCLTCEEPNFNYEA